MFSPLFGVANALARRLTGADIDGGSLWQSFRHVTLPALRPTIGLLSLLAAIFSFRSFTFIYLLTNGGPNSATETLVVHIYNTAFQFYDYSFGATCGVTGFIIGLALGDRVSRGAASRRGRGGPLSSERDRIHNQPETHTPDAAAAAGLGTRLAGHRRMHGHPVPRLPDDP